MRASGVLRCFFLVGRRPEAHESSKAPRAISCTAQRFSGCVQYRTKSCKWGAHQIAGTSCACTPGESRTKSLPSLETHPKHRYSSPHVTANPEIISNPRFSPSSNLPFLPAWRPCSPKNLHGADVTVSEICPPPGPLTTNVVVRLLRGTVLTTYRVLRPALGACRYGQKQTTSRGLQRRADLPPPPPIPVVPWCPGALPRGSVSLGKVAPSCPVPRQRRTSGAHCDRWRGM